MENQSGVDATQLAGTHCCYYAQILLGAAAAAACPCDLWHGNDTRVLEIDHCYEHI